VIDVADEPPFDGAAAVSAEPARRGRRRAWFGDAFVETPAYAGAAVPAHGQVAGPAVVDVASPTLVVPPPWRLTGDGHGTFLLEAE
jgi:N-methylhydantoinase A/oxoprolinase/acetone carboxylase beta subunit